MKKRAKTNHRIYRDLKGVKQSLSRVSKGLKLKANGFVNNSLAQTREKAMEFQDDLQEYVSHKPIKSLSIALVTGAIIGFFVHR